MPALFFFHLHGVHAMGVLSVQEDGTVGGLVDLGEQVKHGGFSRAVGADEAGDLRAADGEVKVVHGFQATELNARLMHSRMGLLSMSRSGIMLLDGW